MTDLWDIAMRYKAFETAHYNGATCGTAVPITMISQGFNGSAPLYRVRQVHLFSHYDSWKA